MLIIYWLALAWLLVKRIKTFKHWAQMTQLQHHGALRRASQTNLLLT